MKLPFLSRTQFQALLDDRDRWRKRYDNETMIREHFSQKCERLEQSLKIVSDQLKNAVRREMQIRAILAGWNAQVASDTTEYEAVSS